MSLIDISEWFNTTVDIMKKAREDDGGGGFTEIDVLIFQDVPARVRTTTGAERETLGKLGQERTHFVYMPTTHNGDPIAIINDAQTFFIRHKGIDFDIFFPDDPHGEGDFLRIEAEVRS